MRTIVKSVFFIFIMILSCTPEDFEKRAYPRFLEEKIVEVSATAATVQATFTHYSADPIIDHGFVWSQQKEVNPGLSNQLSLGSRAEAGSFEGTIDFALRKNTTYYVKPYVKTNAYTVYGDEVMFESEWSLPPTITGFSPANAFPGDTLRIFGQRFSAVSAENKVFLGPYFSTILFATDTLLLVRIPEGMTETSLPIEVITLDHAPVRADLTLAPFQYATPIIRSFSPQEAGFGASITIHGNGFKREKDNNLVQFGTFKAQVLSASATQLVVRVPDSLNVDDPVPISVSVAGKTTIAEQRFSLLPATIVGMNPTEGEIATIIYVYVNNASPIAGNNALYVNDIEVPAFSCGHQDCFGFALPGERFGSRKVKIGFRRFNKTIYNDDLFTLKGWAKKQDLPFAGTGMAHFVINSRGYAGLGSNDQRFFWRYDAAIDTWTRIADFPGAARSKAISFTLGDFAYVGGGVNANGISLQDFWRYNPTTNVWQEVSRFPNSLPVGSTGFTIAGRGFVVLDKNPLEVWEYLPVSNSWTKRAEEMIVPQSFRPIKVFVTATSAYILTTDWSGNVSVFNPLTNQLEPNYSHPYFAELRDILTPIFSDGDKVYAISKLSSYNYTQLHEISFASRKANELVSDQTYTVGEHEDFFGFIINNKLYIGSGKKDQVLLHDFWEYELP